MEKIWILYDLDGNETLCFDELKLYLHEMTQGQELSDAKIGSIFKEIDTNNDLKITKDEMIIFVEKLMVNDTTFKFYSFDELQN